MTPAPHEDGDGWMREMRERIAEVAWNANPGIRWADADDIHKSSWLRVADAILALFADARRAGEEEVARLKALDAEMARAHNSNLLELGALRVEVRRLSELTGVGMATALRIERDETRARVTALEAENRRLREQNAQWLREAVRRDD